MAQSNYSRTKQGNAMMRKESEASRFNINFTAQAKTASPNALSKLSSFHAKQIEEGRAKLDNDSKLFTGVSCMLQGVQNDKTQAREKCVEANMRGATMRFERGLEQAKQWEAQQEYEQEMHRIAGVKRQIQIKKERINGIIDL